MIKALPIAKTIKVDEGTDPAAPVPLVWARLANARKQCLID